MKFSFLIFILALCCTPAQIPSSLVSLKNQSLNWEENDEYYDVPFYYLQKALQARQDKKFELSKHYADLGLVYASRASMEKTINELKTKTKEILLLNKVKENQNNLLEEKISNLKQEEARLQLRKHLETVVDESFRQAAAKEEIKERFYSKEETKIRQKAQKTIALEMIALCRLKLLIISLMEKTTMMELSSPISTMISKAEDSMQQGDMVSIWKYSEQIISTYNGIIEELSFLSGGSNYKQKIAALYSDLEKEGFNPVIENMGISIVLEFSGQILSAETEDLLVLLKDKFQNENQVFSILIISSDLNLPEKKAKTESQSRKTHLQEKFKALDFNHTTFETHHQRPQKSTFGPNASTALLLIPIP